MNNIRKSLTVLALACALFILLGCERHSTDEAATEKGVGYITVKGSDTMVHLLSTWAEDFMRSHPQAEVSITGGGSGTGIAALINGTTDLCATSRPMMEKETQLAAAKGVQPREFIVGRDGIAIIVNPQNPVTGLTMLQLKKIFTGAVTNWQEVGGQDRPILVFSRESSSGTYVFFQEHVLAKADYTQRARLLPGTSAVVQGVAADSGAIGYVGLGFAEHGEGIKTVLVAVDDEGRPVAPSEESVRSGDYPIARPLYLYTKGAPTGLVKEFLDFAMGVAGQKIVKETGYVPM
ncbi:MAG: PstS family phosphate ABC transporter substrate-binding protein [Desulfobulbaceae bacterium]|nr:PstS family phosphate ABC transporter substrate-binding protein [Desulfobulbaceae bacterium]HIJ79520.1 PstS family phosphate ABC transporter substrate-binding protein [Deltaproteobacteria bacterium]